MSINSEPTVATDFRYVVGSDTYSTYYVRDYEVRAGMRSVLNRFYRFIPLGFIWIKNLLHSKSE